MPLVLRFILVLGLLIQPLAGSMGPRCAASPAPVAQRGGCCCGDGAGLACDMGTGACSCGEPQGERPLPPPPSPKPQVEQVLALALTLTAVMPGAPSTRLSSGMTTPPAWRGSQSIQSRLCVWLM